MSQFYTTQFKNLHLTTQPSKSSNSSENFSKDEGIPTTEQIFWVYKLVIMPLEMLSTFLTFNDLKTMKLIFRRLSILIHPDKNSHPMSSNAFQKLNQVYQNAKYHRKNKQILILIKILWKKKQ